MKVGILIAGVKGLNFFKEIHQDCNLGFVSTYPSKGILVDTFNEIKKICSEYNYQFIKKNDLNDDVFKTVDLVFFVGWQYLIKSNCRSFIVFHDSLLPKYRGFSPTVTALIEGEKKIGVTAFKPNETPDAGSICEQVYREISYPIKIRQAYEILGNCYAELARLILDKAKKNTLQFRIQNDSDATFSIWRDKKDLFIDWKWSADKIIRFIDALGWPYMGAKTIYCSQEITIDDVIEIEDLQFVDRHPGKIWSLKNGMPEIICGSGMIRVLSAKNLDNQAFLFHNLRERLG